jgi:hypothetical protein
MGPDEERRKVLESLFLGHSLILVERSHTVTDVVHGQTLVARGAEKETYAGKHQHGGENVNP